MCIIVKTSNVYHPGYMIGRCLHSVDFIIQSGYVPNVDNIGYIMIL
jgi:hypothetical protein